MAVRLANGQNAPMDLTGQRFDQLLVIALLERTRSGSWWQCRCDCGHEIVKLTTQLRRGGTMGCHACERQTRSAAHVQHGGAKFGPSRLYRIWKQMRVRCTNPNVQNFKYYGGKGVQVCEAWQSFETFRAWALAHGYVDRPGATRGTALSIERKDSSGSYDADNCEWISGSENTRRAARRRVAA